MTPQARSVTDAGTVDAPVSGDAAELLRSGDEAAELHTWDEAREAYEAALAQEPSNPEIHKRLGDIYRRLEDQDRARNHYEAAAWNTPDPRRVEATRDACLSLGDLCREQGDAACAARAYNRVLALDTRPRRLARARAGMAKLADGSYVTCSRCGRFSLLSSFKNYGSSRERVCPRCFGASRTGRARQWWLWLVAMLILGLCFLSVFRMPWHSLVVTLINQVLFLATAYAMIVPHELAHAFVTHLLGGRVYEVRIGVGPVLWEQTLAGTLFSLRRYPAGGFTMLAFPQRKGVRLRTLAATAAGIAVSAVVVLLLRPYYDVQRIVWNIALVEALVLVNALLILINMIPLKLNMGWTRTYTDGGHLLRILLGKSTADSLHLRYFLMEGQYAFKQLDFDRAIGICREGLERYPDNTLLKNMLAVVLLEAGKTGEATELFVDILEAWEAQREGADLGVEEDQGEVVRAILLNNVAAALLGGEVDDADLRRAHTLSLRAYEIMPWHSVVEGTWGSVLVLLGFTEQGLSYLEAALPDDGEDERSRAGVLAYIALAHNDLGDADRCAACLEEAVALAPDHYSVRQVKRLLEASRVAERHAPITG